MKAKTRVKNKPVTETYCKIEEGPFIINLEEDYIYNCKTKKFIK